MLGRARPHPRRPAAPAGRPEGDPAWPAWTSRLPALSRNGGPRDAGLENADPQAGRPASAGKTCSPRSQKPARTRRRSGTRPCPCPTPPASPAPGSARFHEFAKDGLAFLVLSHPTSPCRGHPSEQRPGRAGRAGAGLGGPGSGWGGAGRGSGGGGPESSDGFAGTAQARSQELRQKLRASAPRWPSARRARWRSGRERDGGGGCGVAGRGRSGKPAPCFGASRRPGKATETDL